MNRNRSIAFCPSCIVGGLKTRPCLNTYLIVADTTNPSQTTQGSGEDKAHLDAEGLLERERRWMEAIFAASRPDDLRYAATPSSSCWPV